jgi:hypothetical protein
MLHDQGWHNNKVRGVCFQFEVLFISTKNMGNILCVKAGIVAEPAPYHVKSLNDTIFGVREKHRESPGLVP